MKLGKIMALAMAGLSLVSAAAVAMSFSSSDDAAERERQLISQYDIYDKKKMYQEAADTYKQLLSAHPDDYEMFRVYSDYCTQHEFFDEDFAVCRQRIERQSAAEKSGSDELRLLNDESWPFERVMEYMYSHEDKSFYTQLHKYIDIFTAEKYPNINKYLTGLYSQTRGDLKYLSGQYTSVLPWSGDYTIAQNDKGVYCVAGPTGVAAGTSRYGEIYSYSPAEQLIACVHEDQLVYVNFSGSRKRVPFDENKMQLLNYEYLGAFSNGIANIRLSEGNWGYINYDRSGNSIDLIMSGYQYAAPMKGNVGAVKTDGSWKFFSRGKSGFITAEGVYADLYLDEDQNALSECYISVNGTTEYALTAFVKMNEGEGWTPVMIRTSDEGASVTPIGTEKYDEVTPLSGYAAVSAGEKWKVIDAVGNTVLSPECDRLGTYGCGFVSFEKDGRWGYISIDGNTVIDPVYDEVISFNSSGTAFVRENDMWHPIRLKEYVYKEES